ERFVALAGLRTGLAWLTFLESVEKFAAFTLASPVRRPARATNLSTLAVKVRKSGRDLAANASLHGYGAAAAARRLTADLRAAFSILAQPDIQNAYGGADSWQVIERVSTLELGRASNI